MNGRPPFSPDRSIDAVQDGRRARLLAVYLICYICCAMFFQLRSNVPPSVDQSPIEYFTGGLLWMLSLICVMFSDLKSERRGMALLWGAMSAGFVFLAIAEFFGLLAKTTQVVGNDDYATLLLVLCTGGAIIGFNRIDPFRRPERTAFLFGYLFDLVHTATDLGDGEFFIMPLVTLVQLRWAEEILELLALSGYFAAFLLLYFTVHDRKLSTGKASSAVTMV